jgi:uncharacterized damage-inducible protein DinB/ubiquinone/menaquinone biosynthesis C-methylase UbiE
MSEETRGLTEPNALTTFFAHHLWATLRVIEACILLSDDQLDHSDPGAYGSIRATLAHLVRSEERYLTFLTGKEFTTDAPPGTDTALAELQLRARRSGEALREIALQHQSGSLVRLGEGDQVEWLPAEIVLLQAIYHAHEHRTQVNTLLGQLGLNPAHLSAWDYYDEVLDPDPKPQSDLPGYLFAGDIMSDEKTVYATEAERYEALITREDYQNNIPSALESIRRWDGLDVLDLGAGTGRLSGMLAGRARSIVAFDTSHHMLTVTRDKLRELDIPRGLAAVADHRFVPLPSTCADLAVSGWSVSYLAVWTPERWRPELDAWLDEMKRVLRPGGTIVLFESLGTGNDSPKPLPHLENFYPWLDEVGFRNTWIRTDYRFDSVEQAADLSGFFFGEEMAERIRRDQLTILPECTGAWSLSMPGGSR